MSKSLFEEAITDARQLREAAEQNAKNAIIEAVTPKIREFIENQLVGNTTADTGDFLEETLLDEKKEESDDEVELDESALNILSQIFNSKTNESKMDPNMKEAFGSLTEDEKSKLISMLKEQENEDNGIIVQESESFNKNDNMYEIDLDNLRKSIKNENTTKENHMRMHSKEDDFDLDEIMREAEEAEDVSDETAEMPEEEVEEVAPSSGKFVIKLPINMEELVAGATVTGIVEEEGEDTYEIEADEEEEMMPDETGDEEEVEEAPVDESLFEIDENMLRSELSRLREARAKKSKATNLPKSVAASFGGGTAEKFAHEIKMNELDLVNKNALKESRINRELRVQLNEYRSAITTLREQMSDLNLFNAKLLYVNKILQVKSVTQSQRHAIIEALDGAKTLRETKLLYESLTASLTASNKPVNESTTRFAAGGASRSVTSTSVRISEAAEVDRWSLLAGIK